jgi:hypothetical protein
VDFLHVEGLRSKVGSKDFSDLLEDIDIFGTAESWAGLNVFEINGYVNYSERRIQFAEFGRNPGGICS